MPENLLVDSQGPITTITVNRPKALNALNSRTMEELNAAVGSLPAGWDGWVIHASSSTPSRALIMRLIWMS